jgi:hypothetical protein
MFHFSFPTSFAVSMSSTSEYHHPRRTLVVFFRSAIYRNSTPITRKHHCVLSSDLLLKYFSLPLAFVYVLNSSARKTPEFLSQKFNLLQTNIFTTAYFFSQARSYAPRWTAGAMNGT